MASKSLDTACTEEAARAMGYQKLKGEQLEVVSSFIAGNYVFVALPTGFGKSLYNPYPVSTLFSMGVCKPAPY